MGLKQKTRPSIDVQQDFMFPAYCSPSRLYKYTAGVCVYTTIIILGYIKIMTNIALLTYTHETQT